MLFRSLQFIRLYTVNNSTRTDTYNMANTERRKPSTTPNVITIDNSISVVQPHPATAFTSSTCSLPQPHPCSPNATAFPQSINDSQTESLFKMLDVSIVSDIICRCRSISICRYHQLSIIRLVYPTCPNEKKTRVIAN